MSKPGPKDDKLLRFFADLGLKKAVAYTSSCVDNDVTVEMIVEQEVTSDDLKDLGFTVGDRAKIRAHLANVNDHAVTGRARAVGSASTESVASSPFPAKPAAVPLPRLVVPQKVISAGFDYKFLSNPVEAELDLQGLLTHAEYSEAVNDINEILKPARANSLDWILLGLGAGTLLVPWGIRNYRRKKFHKKLLLQSIDSFNEAHPALFMRWRCKPNSELIIERHPAHLEDVAI
jgi:hypothetical protein